MMGFARGTGASDDRIRVSPVALAAALLATLPVAAQAQDTTPAPADAPSIVVTARKFGGTLDKAPVAVTAVSQAALQRDRIQTIQDVAVRVPSLVYNNPSSYGQAYIRGIGSNYSLAGLESAVATYVDGFYLQRQNGAVLDLVDLQGVQVLKGPQGTLYGRNSTGGALLLTTADPTHELGGYVNAEYGRFDQTRVQAVLNLPLTDTLAMRIAGQVAHNGDYLKGLSGSPDMGRTDSGYVRLKLRWTPAPGISATYSVERYRFKTTAFGERENLPDPYCQICGLYDVAPPKGGFYTNSQTPSFNKVHFIGQTLNLTYDTDDFSITSMTGLRIQSTPLLNDQDYMTQNAFTVHVREHGPTFENDTYLRTKFQSPLNGLVGVSYLRERDTQDVHFMGDFVGALDVRNRNKVRVDSISLYGELYYDLGAGFRLTGGMRWNQDDKRNRAFNNPGAMAFFGLPAGAGLEDFELRRKFHSITPRAVLSYDHDGGYYYVSYNRGERSGGFGSPVVAPTDAVKPERLDNFEIGAKNKWFDNRLTTSIAAFYGRYTDIQVQIVDSSTGTVKLQNAAKAKVSGVEFDASLAATRALNLSLGGTYLNNRFKRFTDANVFVPFATYPTPASYGLDGSQKADLSGQVLPRSPHFSGYVSGDYSIPVFGDWSVRLSAIAHYTSKYNFSADAGGPLHNDRQKAYTTVDGAIDLLAAGSKTQIGIWGKNILAAHYYQIVQTATFGGFYVAPMPSSFGVRVSQRF